MIYETDKCLTIDRKIFIGIDLIRLSTSIGASILQKKIYRNRRK